MAPEEPAEVYEPASAGLGAIQSARLRSWRSTMAVSMAHRHWSHWSPDMVASGVQTDGRDQATRRGSIFDVGDDGGQRQLQQQLDGAGFGVVATMQAAAGEKQPEFGARFGEAFTPRGTATQGYEELSPIDLLLQEQPEIARQVARVRGERQGLESSVVKRSFGIRRN